MRLLFISNVFPSPTRPTLGVFNLDMVRALSRGHEVRVVSPISWIEELRSGRTGLGPGRVAIVQGVEARYPRFYYPPRVLRRHYGRFLWLSCRGTIRGLIGSFAPDAILSYWVHPDGEVAVRAAREAGVPAVVMAGGSDVLLLPADRSRAREIRRVLLGADAVVTMSEDLRQKVIGHGVRPDSVHVVSRGVDPSKFSPGDRAEARRRLGIPAGGRALVWVGRMVPVKGLDVLLGACGLLRSGGTEFRVYLVGDGPLRPSLEAEARERGLADVVTFVGPRSHDRLADWYRAADRTVLPSRSEGVPNVLRESLACGTPFVASRVGGIPEVAEDPANLLVPPGDPGALAEALERALREGPAAVRTTTGLAEAAEALTAVIRSVAGGAGGPRPPGRVAVPADERLA